MLSYQHGYHAGNFADVHKHAIYALVLISSLAGHEYNLKSVLILATVLAIGSYVAFIWALKLQMQVWPTFITG